jgi:hypothetical protein
MIQLAVDYAPPHYPVVLENNNGHLMPLSAAELLLFRALLSFPPEEVLVSCPWGVPGEPG